jgi:hypothetical protein
MFDVVGGFPRCIWPLVTLSLEPAFCVILCRRHAAFPAQIFHKFFVFSHLQAEAFESFITAPSKVVYLSLEQAGLLILRTSCLKYTNL